MTLFFGICFILYFSKIGFDFVPEITYKPKLLSMIDYMNG